MSYATRPGEPKPLGATVNDDGVNLSPPVTEGPTISGITGTQGPTRWRVNGSSPFPAAFGSVRGPERWASVG
jgi:hypothetical protein